MPTLTQPADYIYDGSMVTSGPLPAPGLTPEGEQQKDEIDLFLEQERQKLLDFGQASPDLNRMVMNWKEEEDKTLERRKLRRIEINVEESRQAGDLLQDETLVPVRVIDTNIRREQPPFVSYLKQSRRLAVFKVDQMPGEDTQLIEDAFTNGMTYENWESPLIKCLDGSQVHGWDSVEVVYDESKPLHVGVEHIGHERLIFPSDAISIQHASRLIRRYDVTLQQILQFTQEFGFDRTQAGKLMARFKDKLVARNALSTIKIYKVFFRIEGAVWTAWFAEQQIGCDDWLKKPQKLYLGIADKVQVPTQTMSVDPMTGMPMPQTVMQEQWIDKDIQLYPVFILPYAETEEQTIFSFKGRVFLDQYKQEAQTYITSGYVNGIGRASNLYAAVDEQGDQSSSIKQIASLESGVILNRKITFFQPDYPDPSVITGLQWLETSNANETGQVAWAVQNRQDSRKTATEIAAAQNQTSLLNGVQVTLFSTWIRQIFSFAWQIAQSRALQGKVTLLLDPMSGQQRIDLIAKKYTIRAAGDVDVVQRAEKLAEMKQFWPIVAQTPLATPFLMSMLKVAFPDDYNKYEAMLQATNMVGPVLQQMAALLQQQAPEILQGQPPEVQQNFAMLLQQAQQLGQMPTIGMSAGQGGQAGPQQQQPTQPKKEQANGQPS